MTQNNAPRLLLAGTGSGCGKTTVTTAILRALQRRGVTLSAFKCGPDYIDPMFHTAVLGVPSRNLDLFFEDEAGIRSQLARHIRPDGFGVIEGVMGFYDGLGGVSERSSAWEVADLTDTPVILLVDMMGRSLSALASIKGFLDYKEKSHVTGVVFNRLSPMLYPRLKERAERELGIRVFGYVPELKDMTLESRHLGLVMPEEIPGIRERLDLIKEKVRVEINLDGIIEEAGRAAEIEVKLPEAVRQFCNVDCGTGIKKTVVAVAKDEAFCFYYEDNFDVLRELGAELVPFSPLTDERLPENIDGLYLGGGYPELYEKRLSENEIMRDSIKTVILNGLPTVAECGGFLYLLQSLDGAAMAGLLPTSAHMTRRLQPFGYVMLTANSDNLLCEAGGQFPVHEFHYAQAVDNGTDFRAVKPNGRAWDCGFASDTLYAGFPHLYFRAKTEIAANFVRKCAERSGK